MPVPSCGCPTSVPGDGEECVGRANSPTRIAVRDSKAPARATLVLPAEAFAPFLEALKSSPRRP
ncbi:DUF397 domain-containing protein [Streptomyces hirsutus]|uniref:DUF397 domain-containing protein n=1 Tax=Streptomyces hirsutus TaxID=35620 RepID=UPI00367A57C1